MSKIDDGGQAFPIANPGGAPVVGMTLRDWFAGQALAGMLAGSSKIKHDGEEVSGESGFAAAAYSFADAMLAVRAAEKEEAA